MSATQEICFYTATRLRELIASRRLSCEEVVQAHIDRIEDFDSQLNAVVTRCFEQGIERARKLDQQNGPQGLLHGLPIAHKDLVDTKGIRTTRGSLLYRDYVPNTDAPLVTRTREAGAVCVGKTNVPEFGAGSHTFNKVFGPTRNPYDTERTCGGSSGGAGAALAARMLPIADGSDFGGSLRNPGAFCNVIGFRPSPDKPASAGNTNDDIPLVGPMARTVDDVALLFEAMAGPHQLKNLRAQDPNRAVHRLEALDLSSLRIAFTPDFGALPVGREVQSALMKFAETLLDAGAQVDEVSPNFTGAGEVFQVLRGLVFQQRFGKMTRAQQGQLKDTIVWNLEFGNALTPRDVKRAEQVRMLIQAQMAALFEAYDLFIGPSTQVLPFQLTTEWVENIEGHLQETYIDWMMACCWISITTFPCLSLPAGFCGELPVGAQLIADRRNDKKLLAMAKCIEMLTNHHQRLPNLDAA